MVDALIVTPDYLLLPGASQLLQHNRPGTFIPRWSRVAGGLETRMRISHGNDDHEVSTRQGHDLSLARTSCQHLAAMIHTVLYRPTLPTMTGSWHDLARRPLR
ncbi:hypothetical protein RRG08_023982 [Elysia crispata]|uniref:Uncharacterized protein n=1 Tax=Elysia crispata TaxID=231223 RepID=A0AAE0YMW3_9GAST|nr:hypothetical protein RRG08_023982 [Elysia crispata]